MKAGLANFGMFSGKLGVSLKHVFGDTNSYFIVYRQVIDINCVAVCRLGELDEL